MIMLDSSKFRAKVNMRYDTALTTCGGGSHTSGVMLDQIWCWKGEGMN